jgi:hypothetical protein
MDYSKTENFRKKYYCDLAEYKGKCLFKDYLSKISDMCNQERKQEITINHISYFINKIKQITGWKPVNITHKNNKITFSLRKKDILLEEIEICLFKGIVQNNFTKTKAYLLEDKLNSVSVVIRRA